MARRSSAIAPPSALFAPGPSHQQPHIVLGLARLLFVLEDAHDALWLVAVDHVVDEVVAGLVHDRPDPAGAMIAIAVPALGIIVLGLGEAGAEMHPQLELLVVIAEVEL